MVIRQIFRNGKAPLTSGRPFVTLIQEVTLAKSSTLETRHISVTTVQSKDLSQYYSLVIYALLFSHKKNTCDEPLDIIQTFKRIAHNLSKRAMLTIWAHSENIRQKFYSKELHK